MPAVPPSGERQSALRPILLAAVLLSGLLGAAWVFWPRAGPAPEAAAPGPLSAPSLPAAAPAPTAAPAPLPPAVAGAPAAPIPPAAGTPPPPAVTLQAAPSPAAAPALPAVAPAQPPPHAGAAPAAPPRAEAHRTTAPSFDIVRINPRGQAVMAGRAEPGASVVIRDGDTVLGRATADARGEWTFVPDAPLPPGARELTLAARGTGGQETSSAASVLIVVPEPGRDVAGQPAAPQDGRALALLVPDADTAPRVLQAPPAAPPPIPPAASEGARPAATGALGLGVVDYDDAGQVRFAGTASPGATVRLYVDNAAVGDTQAGPDGRWTLAPEATVPAGTHTLRLDQMTPQGRVAARVELPFQRAILPPEALRDGKVVVQPGQSLWRIARAHYGRGARYTVIYEANRDAIRDPDLIYPGQIFDLPTRNN